MQTGWTGGQYSIYRALLALTAGRVLIGRIGQVDFGESGAGLLGAAGAYLAALGLCLALAAGVRERAVSAAVLAAVFGFVALVDGAPLVLPGLDALLLSLLLAAHLAVVSANPPPEAAPFGAWEARGRPDPAGLWQLPDWTPRFAWLALAGVGLVAALSRLAGTSFRPGAAETGPWALFALLFEISAVFGLVRPAWRPPIWLALAIWHFAFFAAFGPALVPTHLWLFHGLALDPAWLPGRRGAPSAEETTQPLSDAPPRLFYDGSCGLCHRSVRILLAEEGRSADAQALRFAPLGGDTFARWLESGGQSRLGGPSAELPDSIILVREDGQVLTRSAAAIDLARRLGGFWQAIGNAAERIPAPIRDGLYDGLASVRKSLFAKPDDACPILPPRLRARFDL